VVAVDQVMMTDRFNLLMDLIDEQAPALMSVEGIVYEGHVQSCLQGEVRVVARAYGTRDTRREYRWDLDAISDIDRLTDAGDDELVEDPLIQQARDMAARAHEYDGLSLAERLLADRNRGEPHGHR
jgi:hypothetical protein